MNQQAFWETSEVVSGPPAGKVAGPKRLRYSVRNQAEFQLCLRDELLSAEDPARVVWEYACGLDLSALTDRIAAVEGGPGARAIAS